MGETVARSIPIDPYDGKPIRFRIVDGQPTVYCVGPDGQDDGGKSEMRGASGKGDILLRLPKSRAL
jgi:hypothetical protein